MDNITFYSSQVFLSEEQTNPDSYIAKFIICDFGRNGNGVALNRNTIEQWVGTLKNKPLVGKITMKYDGTYDFTGHNVKKIEKVDSEGNKYQELEFDTEAFGTFFDVGIETINNTEVIIASCEIWKRFTKACDVIVNRIKSGTLNTSWEISTVDWSQGIVDGLLTKIINVGRFIGHCLLGQNVIPAYQSSGLLEIASMQHDEELELALSQDITESLNINATEGGNQEIMKKNQTNETVKEKINTAESQVTEENTTSSVNENSPDNIDISQLTEWDLRKKIRDACRTKLGKWCYVFMHIPTNNEVWVEADERESELDYVKFTYTIENDVVTVSEPENVKLTVSVAEINTKIAELESAIATKDDAIVKASVEISNLKTENAELIPFKEKFELAEQERITAEQEEKKNTLIASIVKTGFITKEEIETSEELKTFVDSLDEKSLKAIVAERLIESLNNKKDQTVEVSSTENNAIASTNLNNVEDELDTKSIMKTYLGGR